MIGIYKITNTINNHCYIGLSSDIQARWKYHKNPYNWERESYKPVYKAFQKYGIENFTFEILEECSVEELGNKEKMYIAQYNSYRQGYNLTSGGEDHRGEGHPSHKLTVNDVIDIRTRYANLERKSSVCQLYKERIGKSGFSKIWRGDSWKGIKMEVYTEENKSFHSRNTGNQGSTNGRSRLTEEEVYNIRLRKKRGEKLKNVYQDYKDKVTYGSFTNVWSYQNWKNITV